MQIVTASEAKAQFMELLSKAQHESVQINDNGEPVAFVIGPQEHQNIELMKLELLKARVVKAQADIDIGNTIDGDSFIEELIAGKYD